MEALRMHRHIWKVQSSVTQQSPWELLNSFRTLKNFEGGGPELFEQPVIVTYHCEVCGAEKVERV